MGSLFVNRVVAGIDKSYLTIILKSENNAVTVIDGKGVEVPHWPFKTVGL